jgi:hypothetical protein
MPSETTEIEIKLAEIRGEVQGIHSRFDKLELVVSKSIIRAGEAMAISMFCATVFAASAALFGFGRISEGVFLTVIGMAATPVLGPQAKAIFTPQQPNK